MELFTGTFLGGIVGTIVGMIITACVTLNKEDESRSLAAESRNALRRAENKVEVYFKFLLQIEQILKVGTDTKEPAVVIVDKIKEVINAAKQNNNF